MPHSKETYPYVAGLLTAPAFCFVLFLISLPGFVQGFFFLILNAHVGVGVNLSMCATYVQGRTQMREEGTGFPGTGATDIYELSSAGAGHQTQVL